MQQELIGQESAEQIAEWKELFGSNNVFGIKNNGNKIAYFRKPTIDDLNVATSQMDADTPMSFTKDLMTECFLGGSEDLVEVQDDFMGASKSFTKKIEGTKSELVEL